MTTATAPPRIGPVESILLLVATIHLSIPIVALAVALGWIAARAQRPRRA